jgi:putative flippase GtrA
MNPKMKKLLSSQIVKYLFWGVATTVVSIAVYAILVKSYESINKVEIVPVFINGVFTTISSIVGIIFAFYTNRKYVFESKAVTKKEKRSEFISFTTARIATLVLDLVIVLLGSKFFPGAEIIVKIVSQIIVIVLNYILTKLVFNKNKNNTKKS